VPGGLGEPVFDRLEADLGKAMLSLPATKGFEIGSGFAGARLRGSEHNDMIINADGCTATNNAGGIVGGISNGNEIIVRVAVKPTASISREQQTFNFAHQSIEGLTIKGRHDVCIALRAAVVIENAIAIALADLKLRA
jgi:chorismate synthase